LIVSSSQSVLFFFFHVPATTEIYTLSLHDALPICQILRHDRAGANHHVVADSYRQDRRVRAEADAVADLGRAPQILAALRRAAGDRKSTRLNSSHRTISYAVFCLKKKKKQQITAQH